MKCRKCGTEFSEGIFCPMCGTKNAETIINNEKEVTKQIHEKKVKEEVLKKEQEKDKNKFLADEGIKDDANKFVREETFQNTKYEEEMKQWEELNRKVKAEKKINRKAIISLILGIASWIGMITVIVPIVGGIWAIIDGCKALKGKTKYKKSAVIGIVLPILFYVLLIILCVYDVVSGAKRDAQLNFYIENGEYAEAQEFIAQEYGVGTPLYVEKCAQLYELQGMYDEAVDLWVEYCSNEYKPIDIPAYRINKLNEYLDKYGADLKPETIEKVHNLIHSKEAAKAEEQAKTEEQAVKEVEEQAVKETERTVTDAVTENISEFNAKNNDTMGNITNEVEVNGVSDSTKTFYNNGHPHTYKYEDKDYYIIAELQMDYYDEFTFAISLKRYDHDKNFETYNLHAQVNLVQDEKGNDHDSNGTYYRGWDLDNGTDIFVVFNYETEYCRIKINMPEDVSGYNFDYVFDHEYIYYPEEADGVDDGIADLDNYSDADAFFITMGDDYMPIIAEENIGKTFRLTCSYKGIEEGYMVFYHNAYSGAGGSFSVYGKTDKDFGSLFSGDQVYLTAIWQGKDMVGSEYVFIIDIIDLQIIN